MKTIVGLYDDIYDARAAVEDLVSSGYDRNNISLVAADEQGRYASDLERYGAKDTHGTGEAAAEGAVAGGAIGGLAGVLIGLGAVAIPGLGPVIAAGPIIAGLVGAGIGAVSGGLIGALVEWGLSEEEAGYYVEGVRRGGTLVAVKAADFEANDVVSIMNRHNPVDIDRRAEDWRSEGWTGYTADETATMPERHQYTAPRREFTEYETTVPKTEDELHTGNWDVQEPIRHTVVDIEPVAIGAEYDSDYTATYRNNFRTHYNTTYANTAYDFDTYEPAYYYGYTIASDDRYRDLDWDDIRPEVRRRWEERNEGTWEEFKDAVRYAWESAKRAL